MLIYRDVFVAGFRPVEKAGWALTPKRGRKFVARMIGCHGM
jgi:hypothetical protein